MDDLQSFYRDALRERIADLERNLAQLRAGDAGVVPTIRRLAHSLRGSGATYGFPEITAAASAAEEASDDALREAGQQLLQVMVAVQAGGAPPDRLLLVDDDPVLLRFLQQALAAPGRELVVAESFAQATRLIAEQSFPLVILDLVLPDGDGRHLLRQIRASQPYDEATTLILSAVGGVQPKIECYALGADAYIQKSLDAEALRAAVQERLTSPAARHAARRDAATGLLNEAAFQEVFDQVTADLRQLPDAILHAGILRPQQPATAAPYHDEAGQRHTAQRLREAFHERGLLGWWGPSSFAFLLAQTTPAEAEAWLHVLLRAAGSGEDEARGAEVFQGGVVPVTPDTALRDALDRAAHQMVGEAAAGVVPAAPRTSAAPLPILLVEDDELVATVIKHRLGREGLVVLHFDDGLAALDAARETPVSLAILDVKLPGMDGFELLENLRASPATAPLPIMMLTAMGSEQDVVRGFELGADDYVLKPFSPVEVLARVHRLLKKR